MKKRWFALGLVALAAVGGYQTLEANKYRRPGIVQDWRDPVQPTRAGGCQQGPTTPPAAKRPPNIILSVADDMGWNDISLNGGGVAGGVVKTPNIDALARQGVDFTTAYAANATCSPSRAAMLTGRYPTRFGFEYTAVRSEEHTSELQSLMRISYAVFCLKKKKHSTLQAQCIAEESA